MWLWKDFKVVRILTRSSRENIFSCSIYSVAVALVLLQLYVVEICLVCILIFLLAPLVVFLAIYYR